jgi:XTP/dITP diphosphohydrolase
MTTTLVLATHNEGKIAEMDARLKGLGVTVKTAKSYDCPEPEETGETFLENALIKARFVAQFTGEIALADDSGLCVTGLNGAPGVYSADWAFDDTGGARDFNKAMARVVDELRAANVPQPWTASFNAIMVLCHPHGEFEVFKGECKGEIVWPPRGEHGHGYDPIFVPEGETRTFAEMTLDEKNRISHRAAALAQLVAAWPELDLAA